MANGKNKGKGTEAMEATAEQAGQAVNTPIPTKQFTKPEISQADNYRVTSWEKQGESIQIKGTIDCPIQADGTSAHWQCAVDLTVDGDQVVRAYLRHLRYALDSKILPDGPIPATLDNATLAELTARTSGGGASAIAPEFHAQKDSLVQRNVAVPKDFLDKAGKGGKWTASAVKAVYDYGKAEGKFAGFVKEVDDLRAALAKNAKKEATNLFD